MRGKKTDPKFVSDFIQQCVTKLNIHTSDDIIKHAKSLIQEIDDEIKILEKKKITRSKLLDVVAAFEKTNKEKNDEAKLLDFFKLSDPKTCKNICDSLKANTSIKLKDYLDPDILFTIKQLLEYKILFRSDDQIIRGERFDEYMTFVLRED